MDLPWNMNSMSQRKEATAIYLRVSTKRQGEEGLSIATQTVACKKLAQDNGWMVSDNLIFEENISASRIDGIDYNIDNLDSPLIRPGIKKLLLCASKKMFKHLIVYSRDRLTRVAEEALAIEVALSKYGIDIHYSKPGETISTDNKSIDRFIHLVFLCISEYESGLISKRVKSGNKNCVEKGYWPGGVTPIGYIRKVVPGQTNKKNTLLTASDFESSLVKEVYQLYLDGIGYKRIADIMNERHSYIKWSKSKIETIIKNQTYSGSIIWDKRGGRRYPGKHKTTTSSPYNENMEIISNKEWQLSKDFRVKREKTKDPYYHTSKYILKNVLYCSICKNEMKPINPGKNKTEVYRCSYCKSDDSGTYNRIPYKDIEAMFIDYIKSEIIDNIETNSNIFYTYLNSISKCNITINNFIAELDKRINNETTKLNNLKTILSDSKTPQSLITILTEQTGIYYNLLDQYNSSRAYYKTLIIDTPKSEEEFLSLFCQWKDILFNTSLAEESLIFQRRKFIITFFDKIFVKKLKEDNRIIIDEIIFN